MRRPLCALLLAACAGLAGPARADEVLLVNGTRFEGKVLGAKCDRCGGSGRMQCAACRGSGKKPARAGRKRECPTCAGKGWIQCAKCSGLGTAAKTVRVRLRAGIVTLNRAEVRRITWRAVDPERLLPVRVNYNNRLAKLKEGDAKGHFALAVWCYDKKLGPEARKHFEAAVKLDRKTCAKQAAPYLEALRRRVETSAVKALLAALSAFERKGPEAGAPLIRAVQREFPDTEIVRRAELQRDLLGKHFPKLAAGGADTLEALLRSVADRAAARCPVCKGTGQVACADCGGTGAGPCPDCAGAGRVRCPVCRGTRRLTCPKCYGSGKTKTGTIGYGKRNCPTCGGRGEVGCDVCDAKGLVRCRRCAGTGRVAGTCPTCRGKGRVACPACAGSGVRQVVKFTWGPPPVRRAGVVTVVGPRARSRAWQGEYHGAAITAVPAEVLWRGALTRNIGKLAGGRLCLVAVAVDNRKGKKLLRFRPASFTLRGVTPAAGQVKMARLARLLAPKAGDRQAQAVIKAAGDADCLPGAYVCVVAAFPQGTEPGKLANLFWVPTGAGDPARLGPIWLSADEVEKLRKSLRVR